MAETIDENGEVHTTVSSALSVIGSANQSLVAQMVRAEIDTLVTTARQYPRSVDRAVKMLKSIVTIDQASAMECIYALPRGGKPIRGASVRFAEAALTSWGNAMVDARVIHVDREEKVVIAEGSYRDLETNVMTRASVRRRIVDARGKIYSDDLIIVTGNAACSIARRNVILAGIPKPVWRAAYEAVEQTIAGTAQTLSVTRGKAVESFAMFGIKPEQVFAALGVKGMDDIQLDQVITLRGMYAAIKNEEATVEEIFNLRAGGGKPEGVVDPLGTSKPVDKPAPNAATSSGDGEIPPAKSEVKAGEADSTGASPVENKTEGWGQTVTSGTVAQATEKVADEHPAPAAPEGAAKAEAKPVDTPATAPPVPATLDEYRAHVLAYVAQATSASALEARWKAKDISPGDKLGDRSLRTKLNIEKELFDELEAVVKAKCAELKGGTT